MSVTQEQKDRIVRMHGAGMNFPAIAKQLGLTRHTVKHVYNRLFPPDPGVGVDVERFKEMWASGASRGELARQFNVSRNTIEAWRHRYGLPVRFAAPKVDLAWSETDIARLIEAGYNATETDLVRLFPDRSAIGCMKMRRRLVRKGLIDRPAHLSRMTLAERAVAGPKPPRVRVRKPKVVKPPRVLLTAEGRSDRSRKAWETRRANMPTPPPPPVVEPQPVVELQPGEERVLFRTWPVIKDIAARCGVVMQGPHDITKLNARRAQLRMPPVFFRKQAPADY